MKKAILKKVLSLTLTMAIMISCALFISVSNSSVSNALTGLSGGTSLSGTAVKFVNYTGEITTYSDGSTRRAALTRPYVMFYYGPSPCSLIDGEPEVTLKDSQGNSIKVTGVMGSYSSSGYHRSNYYTFTLPHKGSYRLICQVKDIYGYLYSRIVYINYY